MPTTTPSNIDLTISQDPKDIHRQDVQVNVPATGAIPKIDVYFLTDSTGSMSNVIDKVRAGSSEILEKLGRAAGDVGADMWLGVGNYRDIFDPKEDWFAHQVSLTADTAAVKSGIDAWKAGGGDSTVAEGQFYALDQLAQRPRGSIGWREDAKRIILWFGDAPGHDPISATVTGLPYDISEASVTEKLKAEKIFVLAISCQRSNGVGLNSDPTPHSHIGGNPGQGTSLARATQGTYAEIINTDEIVAKIIELGTAGITNIGNVKLEPDKKIAPFVQVDPPAGHGELTSGREHNLTFTLEFPGTKRSAASAAKAKTTSVAVTGKIAVKVDGVTTGEIRVMINVPDMSGTYRIRNTRSNLYLQLKSPRWDGDGANTAQNKYTGAAAEQWELIPVPGGGYQIKNVHSEKRDRYLEVAGTSIDKNGAEILTRHNPTGQNKEWMLIPAGASNSEGTVFQIKNRQSGKAIEILHQSTAPGALAVQQSYWGDWKTYQQEHHQHWYLQRV